MMPPPSPAVRGNGVPCTTARRAHLEAIRMQSAAVLRQDHLVLGLGTGSTAASAVIEIGVLLATGKLEKIVGVPRSKHTFEQVQLLGISLPMLNDHLRTDLTIDGAGEVRSCLNCITKGL